MKKQNTGLQDASILRQRAEEHLKKRKAKHSLSFSEADMLKLIHELEVHQIELEMQNEELVIAKEKAELAEEKYTELYDFAPSGYLSLTKDGHIKELNFAAAKILGKSRSVLIKSQFSKYLSENTDSHFKHFFHNIFESKIKQSCEVKITTDDNLPIDANIEGIISQNDEFCILTLIDITKRKQTEKELLKAKQDAEESDRLKSAFLANMSHEIRTPMNGILGFAELLKEPELSGEKQQAYISIIEQSGTRMLNIINDIIDISKIEAGLMNLKISDTNINDNIEYLYTFFKPEVEGKGMTLQFKAPLSAQEATIATDREKAYAILTNLVKNAIKYSNEGTIELGYELFAGAAPALPLSGKAMLQFYVKDTGLGIPKEKHKAIFERFIQADNSNTKTYQGAGLGLAITKAYVEMLGGKIWVESEEGIGSTFYFTLPYQPVAIKTGINEKSGNANNTDEVRKLKVLIAEDDKISEMLLENTVKAFSNDILKVRNGIEALEACRRHPEIDLVLMDIQMPEMTGYEATQKIREFNNDVVIIAQTANALSADRDKAIEAGCNDYISKPIKKMELLALVKKYFD